MRGVEADRLARQLQLHLQKNQFEACHTILQTAEKDLPASNGYTRYLAELHIDMRWLSMLEKAEYELISDFDEYTTEESLDKVLSHIRFFGKAARRQAVVAIIKARKHNEEVDRDRELEAIRASGYDDGD